MLQRGYISKHFSYRTLLAGCVMLVMVPLAQADGHPPMGMSCHEHGPGMMGHQGHGMVGHHMGWRMMFPHNAAAHLLMAADRLGLNTDQEAKLRQMRDKYIQDNSASEKELWAAREDLASLLRSGNLETASVDRLVTQIGRIEGSLWKAYIQQLREIKSMLTPDQLKMLRGHEHHEADADDDDDQYEESEDQSGDS